MKKLKIALLSATMLVNCAFADNVVATFKGGEVKESQVMTQFKPALDMQPGNKDKKFSDLEPNIQEALVRGYINIKLLDEEAKAANIESTKEFQDKLNLAKTQMLQQEVIERYVKTAVTDKMIDAEYNKMVENLKGKEELKVAHILVENEEKAKEVKKKLSKGAKFDTIAKEMSKDEGTKVNGGELGYVTKGQLVPEFENKAFSMKVNEISDPVKTQFGWHVIKVLDKRPAKPQSAEEAKPMIQAKLSREVVEKYFAELAEKASVKLNLPAKAAPAATAPAATPAK